MGADALPDRSTSSAMPQSAPAPFYATGRVSRPVALPNRVLAEADAESREGAAQQRKFAMPLIGNVPLPWIGRSADKKFSRTKVEQSIVNELIQAVEFQDLYIPEGRINAVDNISQAIRLARVDCAKLQYRLSTHIAAKIRDLLTEEQSAALFESSADLDCKRFSNHRFFQQFLEKACETENRFIEIARIIYNKHDRRAFYHKVFAALEAEAGAYVGDAARLTFLKQMWNGAVASTNEPQRGATIEYVSFSLAGLPDSQSRQEFASHMIAYLPGLSNDANDVVTLHLEPCLQGVRTGTTVLATKPEVPTAPLQTSASSPHPVP